MNEIKFPCSGCGVCCKRVDRLAKENGIDKLSPDDPLYFPYKHDETGRCENLLPDNSCAVYETRPLICNIDKTGEHLGIKKEILHYNNIKKCNTMMAEDKIDEKFRIPFPEWLKKGFPEMFRRKPKGKGIGSNYTAPKKKRRR